MANNPDHLPVLVDEFLSFFKDVHIRFFVDGTLGAGGHSEALLKNHPEIECLIGLDQDTKALEIARKRLSHDQKRVKLIHANFRAMKEVVPFPEVDGIFLDLGVSSMQLDQAERGFSIYKEGPLDMRMDPTQDKTAATIINTYSQKELERIFREYGEEPRAKNAAKAIVEARKKVRIKTTQDLMEVLKQVLTWRGRKSKKIHPLTLVFQALRIEVNEELEALEKAIPEAISLLRSGGRMGIISFHSLEDRIVKTRFKEFAEKGEVRILTKKPLEASPEEKRKNPRARSAKMRFVEKI